MSAHWLLSLMSLVPAVALVTSLITKKAFNPLRGTRPMIVTRDQQPGRYWSSIALCVAFGVLALGIAWAPILN